MIETRFWNEAFSVFVVVMGKLWAVEGAGDRGSVGCGCGLAVTSEVILGNRGAKS